MYLFRSTVKLFCEVYLHSLPPGAVTDIYHNTPLISACIKNNEKFALELLSCAASLPSGLGIARAGESGRSALHWAVSNTMLRVIETLVAHHRDQIDFSAREAKGDTVVTMAAQSGQWGLVETFLQAGANVNIQGENGQTVLHWAIIHQTGSVLDRLLGVKGIDPDIQNAERDTALILAAKQQQDSAVRRLLDHRADVNIQGSSGRTVLHWLCHHGNLDILEQILKTCTDCCNVIDESRDSALLVSLKHKYPACALQLLRVPGIDIGHVDQSGSSALHYICLYGQVEVLRSFLLLPESAELDYNKPDGGGNTPLLLASERGHGSVLQLLLSCQMSSVDVNAVGQHSRSVLYYCARRGLRKVVEMLLSAGAVADLPACEPSPLIQAAKEGHVTTVEVLLTHGADCNGRDGIGRTALIWAAQSGHTQCMRVLLEAGAEVKVTDDTGRSRHGDRNIAHIKQHG